MNVTQLLMDPDLSINETPCYYNSKYYKGSNPHYHNYNEIIYVSSGTLINSLTDMTQLVSAKQLLFSRATDIHSCRPTDVNDFEMYSIGISNDLFYRISDLYGKDPSFLLTPKSPPLASLTVAEHHQLQNNLIAASKNKFGKNHGQIVLNIISNALFYLYNPTSDSGTQLMPKWFSNLIAQISNSNNYTNRIIKLRDISNYSNEYLCRCFKKYLGLTPTQYINNLKADYASKLLIESDLKIVDICYTCGYSNEGYFYKCFYKRFGCTPKEFKKQFSKKE